MKKLLFVVYGLGIGGVEKCLVNLVNYLDPDKYSITIAIMNPEYDFLEEIRTLVRVIRFEDQFVNTQNTMPLIRRKKGILPKIKLLTQYVFYRAAVKMNLCPWLMQRWIDEEYDYAIAYTHTGYVPNYVIDRTRAKKKVLWYHTLWIDPKNLKCYRKFDYIIAVSIFCKNNFITAYPELRDKTLVLYNLYNFEDIQEKALQKATEFNESGKIVVTVGRLSPEKGFELAIRTCAVLKEKLDEPFHWFWVGDGPEEFRMQAERMISELSLEHYFYLLGNKWNPYPYMKLCDVYVQPSEREAFCTTIIEAKTLKKPIVATNVGSIYEQVEDGENAFVVEHIPEKVAEKIACLIKSPELRSAFSDNCLQSETYNLKQASKYNIFFDV